MNDNHQKINPLPLLVDLDGSIIKTDTLFESAIQYVKRNPFRVVQLCLWTIKGKLFLKKKLSEHTTLDSDSLPYREEVLQFLQKERSTGRNLILVTGAREEIGRKINEHLELFDQVVGTSDEVNLTGNDKRDWANATYGESNYDYLGNEEKDISVWRCARNSIVIGDETLNNLAKQVSHVEHHFPTPKANATVFLKMIRVHQWAKNALVFVPLITAQDFLSAGSVWHATLAFIALSFCASATYIINDLMDLGADRKHHTKKNRPIAAGLVSIPSSLLVSIILMTLGLGISILALPDLFLLALVIYVALTVLYSFKFKQLQTIDVISLACLFTIRVMAGGAAINVPLSFWLLSFSMFLFLSLAIVKRVAELIHLESSLENSDQAAKGRGYTTSDINILISLGSSAGFISVLVIALYINSNEVTALYEHPEILWLICPVLGYWIMRIWMLVARNQMNEDPIFFAVTDRNSWLAAIIIVLDLAIAYII